MHTLVPPIAHLDIKSPNTLVTSVNANSEAPCGKITDFGTCEPVTGKLHGRAVMNPIWSAPEILAELTDGYDHTSDIYAYGITLWELFSREEPWSEKSFWGDVTDAVLAGERPEVPIWWPEEYVTIMKQCWVCLGELYLDLMSTRRNLQLIAPRGAKQSLRSWLCIPS